MNHELALQSNRNAEIKLLSGYINYMVAVLLCIVAAPIESVNLIHIVCELFIKHIQKLTEK
jgi:hypothetical protein